MGNAGQLARSFRLRVPAHRRDEQPVLPRRAAWTVAIVTIVSRSALSTIVALLLWSVLPNLVGFQTTTVMSGSMEPRLMVGDAIIVRHMDAADLAPGEVLLFDDPDHPGRLRMHRLVTVETDGELITRGDANPTRDSSPIEFSAVKGAAFLRIPSAGLPNFWIRTGQSLPLVGGGALVLLLMGGIRLGRLLEEPEDRQRRRHRGIRLPGMHRATAATAALIVLSAGFVAPSAPSAAAHASYSATTSSTGNTWGTTCTDRVPTDLGAGPRLYWGYGTGTAPDVTDLSGQGDTGTSPASSDATPVTCTGGASPAVQVGGTAKGLVVEKVAHAFPGAMTVATWFRTTSPGGVLADFGASSSVTSPSASIGIDRALYMRSDGNLSFGANTISVAGLLSAPMFCTTTKSGGYADGSWHLVVATYSNTAGCTVTVDSATPVTTSAGGLGLLLLSGYPGYWRFGYDAVSAANGWTGATTRQYFQGALDESQVYNAIVAAGPILSRGH